jgi:hypothetical protein
MVFKGDDIFFTGQLAEIGFCGRSGITVLRSKQFDDCGRFGGIGHGVGAEQPGQGQTGECDSKRLHEPSPLNSKMKYTCTLTVWSPVYSQLHQRLMQ